jgi:KaiC/GvpD/RAD55 family RecA-like ATPase
MAAVTAKQCEEFLNFLYGKESGFVYAPTLATNKEFTKHFFQWPDDRSRIVSHILNNADKNVYIAPALFETKANATIDNVKGSNVVWADFDGNAPDAELLKKAKVTTPAMRIQSSVSGKEHWYWKLDVFETDILTFQSINKAITYALDADPSGWNANKVLRPLGSLNHKPEYDEPIAAQVKNFSNTVHKVDDFDKLPQPETRFDKSMFDAMGKPPNMWVVLFSGIGLKPEEFSVLFKAGNLEGRRAKLLYKFASYLAEKGCSDSQIYGVISGMDKKANWRKFSERHNAEACYIALIDKVRQKHPYQSPTEISSGYERMTFTQHFTEVEEVAYILGNVVVPGGLTLFTGKSNSGKTMLAMEIAYNLSVGTGMITWGMPDPTPRKVLYFSYEMNKQENRGRFDKWFERSSEEERAMVERNFPTFYPKEAMRFYVIADQARIVQLIEREKPDGILIDSVSLSFASHANAEDEMMESVRFIKKLMERYNLFSLVIHHPRKDPPGTRSRTDDVDTVHGAQVLINQSQVAIHLKRLRDENETEEGVSLEFDISCTKHRLESPFPTFRMVLDPATLRFSRPAIAPLPKVQEKPREITAAPVKRGLGKLAKKPDEKDGF